LGPGRLLKISESCVYPIVPNDLLIVVWRNQNAIGGSISADTFQDAVLLLEDLDTNDFDWHEWPLIATDGDCAALIQLVSENKVTNFCPICFCGLTSTFRWISELTLPFLKPHDLHLIGIVRKLVSGLRVLCRCLKTDHRRWRSYRDNDQSSVSSWVAGHRRNLIEDRSFRINSIGHW
jgi:hypothetical protein